MNINRRDFIAGAGAILSTGAVARPIRSLLSPRESDASSPFNPTAADYIQDGLVALWDAIENGGPGVHDPTLNKNTWVEWCGTGWKLDQDRGGFFQDDWFGQTEIRTAYNQNYSSALNALLSQTYTWEMTLGEVYFTPESNTREYFIGTYGRTSSGNFRNIAYYETGTHATGSSDVYPSVYVSPNSCLGIVYRCDVEAGSATYTLKENGCLVSERTKSFPTDYACAYIYTQPFAHKFHCMRIYDRILTPQELAYNESIDRLRFNLP